MRSIAMFPFRTLMTLILLLMPLLSFAELDTGLKKLKQEMNRDALIELEKKAAKGDPRDAYELSQLYLQGIGTKPDMAKSVAWLSKAAEKGHLDAQFSLGYRYLTGNGVKRSIHTALGLLTKAGNKGHANAQFYLGNVCETGEGLTAPDKAKAAAWYKMAAERGHSEAMFRLAMHYQAGTGVDKNEAEARRWLKTAADKGHVLAKGELDRLNPQQRNPNPSATPRPAQGIIMVPEKK